MKRIIGILLLVIACIALGLSVDYAREEDATLVSRWNFEYGGVYE